MLASAHRRLRGPWNRKRHDKQKCNQAALALAKKAEFRKHDQEI
jgi:hypothetical protein